MAFDPSAARSGSVFSTNPAYAAAWVCYVNGVEIPITGWQINTQIWQIPSFTIHCVPDPVIQRLGSEDRVPVQIFYLDHWAQDEPTFRLLIDGEIVGWSFSSSTGARTIAFSCLAHIHIFQQLYFFYMTNVDDVVASRNPSALAQGFATPGLLYPYGIFHQGLLTTSDQARAVTPQYDVNGRAVSALPATGPEGPPAAGTETILAPYELVTNVIKGVISSEVPKDRRAVPMMNFFARHIRKVRFHNRWVRLPLLEDADRLADRRGVFPIFNAARSDESLAAMQRQVVSQVGSSGPVWNLFQQVLSIVYMEIAMLTNPACVRVKLAPRGPGQPEEGKILRPLSDADATTTYRRGLVTTGQQDTDPLYRQAEANVDERDRLARLAAEAATPTVPVTAREAVDDPFRYAPSVAAPGAGVRVLPEDAAQRDAQTVADRNAAARTAAVGAEYARLVRERQQTLADNNTTDRTVAGPTEPIRLAQYFVKPNFFFGEVPSCNVILPSMVVSLTYDESFINQPTREYVNDSVMTRALRATGTNQEFMLHGLTVGWPEEANALMRHRAGTESGSRTTNAAHGSESGRNLLIWPEEFYKGPVTGRTPLPAWFQMLQQMANGARVPNNQNSDLFNQGPAVTGSGVVAPTDAGRPPAVSASLYTPDTASPGRGVLTPSTASTSNAAAVYLPPSQLLTSATATARASTPLPQAAAATYAVPTQIRVGGAQRGTIVTLLSIGGSRVYRDTLATGTGLDPATYIPPTYTAPWPFTRGTPQRPGGRIGRSGGAPGWRPAYTARVRVAILAKKFFDEMPALFPEVTETQHKLGVAFGLAWLTLQEVGVRAPWLSWALGNQRQYRAYPRGSWTINPFGAGGPLAYAAAADFTSGVQNLVAHLRDNPYHAAALRTLITGEPPAPLQAAMRAAGRSMEDSFWGVARPARPDLFYIHLGFVNYYAGGFDAGLTRTSSSSGMQSYFAEFRRLFEQGQIPEPTTFTAPIDRGSLKPLYAASDAALLAQTGAPAQGQAAPGDGAQEGDAFSKLFELYTENEYLKQRYAQRSAGASLAFNPYVVVGFPAMLFDSVATGLHWTGYLTGVSHSGYVSSGASTLATTVQMQFCRTLYEFIYDVQTDAARFKGRVTSAPAEIIDEIRGVIQDDQFAEEFYQKLLYGGAPPRHTPACFRWERVLGYARGAGTTEIYIEGASVAQQVAEAATPTENDSTQGDRNVQAAAVAGTTPPGPSTTSAPPQPPPQRSTAAGFDNNLNANLELAVRADSQYADAFDSYDIAMRLAARPACTLDEFIRFWHGGRTVNDLLAEGFVAEPREEFAYAQVRTVDVIRRNADGTQTRGTVTRPSATFYGRIFKLRVGPGTQPTEAQRGYTTGPDINPAPINEGVPAEYPETRADWDAMLNDYRDRVRKLLSPST